MLIAICDDEPQELEAVKTALLLAAENLFVAVKITGYTAGETLLQSVENGLRPDFVILDIYMDAMDGITTARRLQERIPGLPLAFLTASRDHAIDAFELCALHYLLKPITEEKVQALLYRFLTQVPQDPPALVLSAGRKEYRFPICRIQYLESQDRGTVLHLEGQLRSQWMACPFQRATEQLAENPDFLKISRGCMVHLNAVQYIGRESCHMKNGESLTISRRKRQTVESRYHDFLFRKMSQMQECTI